MKKAVSLFVVGMALFFNSNMALALDSEKRVKELQQEAQLLLDERQKHLSEITRIEVRIYEINGALKELLPPPAEAKAEVKAEEKKK